MIRQWTNLRGFLFFTIIFLLVVALDVIVVYNYYHYVEDFLEDQPGNFSADAGIVFFGDYTHRGARLGADSRQRAEAAIELYKQGAIRNIICVGGYETHQWRGKPHLMKQYLLLNGIPENRIHHDSLSFNTITNWQEACKIMELNNFSKVVAISAPLHTFRISRMIHEETVYFHAYHFEPHRMTDYWQIFKDVHREWVSHFLSAALNDRLRNRTVYFYRTLKFELNKVL